MFPRRLLRQGISFAVCISILSISPAPLWANRAPSPIESAANFTPDFNLPGHQAQDPLMQKFAASPWQNPKWGPFDAKDPVLDQDPFFMRSQNYSTPFSHGNGEGTAYKLYRGAIEIHLPNTSQSLIIRQPLAPLFEIQNFLVLQATDPALFAGKSSGPDSYGEGLFFIDKRYIYTELRKPNDHRPVPVFFLPLEGKGWTNKIQFIAVGPNTTFAFRNQTGEQSTLDLTQITQLARLLHNNVVITTLIAMKNNIAVIRQLRAKWLAQTGEKLELPFVYPPRGSTAAFGTMIAGVDLDNPSKGLFPVRGAGSTWNFDLLPKAHAFDMLTPDVLHRLLVVAAITGTAFVTGWVAQYSILRKRMLERRAFIEAKEDQLAAKEGRTPPKRAGAWHKVKTEFKETVDVFSHGLATLSSGFGISLGFLLEYGADRFLGKQGTNGMIRWFLDKTFLYNRKANELIGANWNTFFLGVVILGGIDTLSVALQLLFVSPIFFPWVGRQISPEKEEQAAHEFSGKDAETNNNVTSEIMRNLTSYFVSGAYSYSQSQRMVLLEIVRPEVERQMATEGKDIHDPRFRKEYDKRIETRLELMLVERGLPTNEEFLFSSPSMFRGFAHLMGYKVNRARLYESKDYRRADDSKADEKELELFRDRKNLERRVSQRVDALMELARQYPENKVETDRFIKAAHAYKTSLVMQLEKSFDNETFVLENARWGLISHALKRSLGAALELLEQDPGNPHLKAAVDILRETRTKYHAFWRIAKNPFRTSTAIKEYRQIAEVLAALSYEDGVVGTGVKYLDLWDAAKTQPEGALIAGRMFRQALFGLIQNKPEFLKPTAEDVAKYLPDAREKASELIAAAPGELGYDEQDKEIVALEIVKTQVKDDQRKATAEKWKPQKQDMLEIGQRENAHREALTKVVEASGGRIEPSPAIEQALEAGSVEAARAAMGPLWSEAEQLLVQNPELFNVYREEYRKALTDSVGLIALPAQESELVRKAMEFADKDVQLNQQENPGWNEYMNQLDEIGKVRFLTHQYADSFLSKYAELTVSNSSSVSLTSPEQPGWFQKPRQWSIAKKDTWYGRTIRTVLRALESPMDATAYRPGLNNMARRNIPWYQDGKTTLFTSFRLMWTAMTIGWLTQYYVWQVTFSWPTYLFFFWVSGFTSIVHYWTDRLMMNMGVRPMQTTWGKVKYSLLYTWLTYPTYLPFFFFVKDFQKFWSSYVTTPLQNYLVEPVLSTCEKLLSALF